jgi:hypothetical protein
LNLLIVSRNPSAQDEHGIAVPGKLKALTRWQCAGSRGCVSGPKLACTEIL